MISIFTKILCKIPRGTKNGLYTLSGEGVSRVLMVMGTLFAARQMGSATYGEYGILWAQMQIAWSIIEFGTTMSGTRDFAKALSQNNISHLICGIYYLRLIIFSSLILGWLVTSIGFKLIIFPGIEKFELIAIYLLSMVFTPDWILRGSEHFKKISLIQLYSAVFYVILTTSLTIYFHSVEALLLAHIAQVALSTLLQWLTISQFLQYTVTTPSINAICNYAKRGAFFAFTGTLLQGALTGFIWGSGRFFGEHAMGLVTVLIRIYQLINAASFMMATGYLPRLAQQKTAGNEQTSLEWLMWLSGLTFAILFPIIIVPSVVLFLGHEYVKINALALGASAGLALGALRYIHSIPLVAKMHHWETIAANSTYFLMTILSTLILGYYLPFEWISLAITLGEASALAVIILSRKNFRAFNESI